MSKAVMSVVIPMRMVGTELLPSASRDHVENLGLFVRVPGSEREDHWIIRLLDNGVLEVTHGPAGRDDMAVLPRGGNTVLLVPDRLLEGGL